MNNPSNRPNTHFQSTWNALPVATFLLLVGATISLVANLFGSRNDALTWICALGSACIATSFASRSPRVIGLTFIFGFPQALFFGFMVFVWSAQLAEKADNRATDQLTNAVKRQDVQEVRRLIERKRADIHLNRGGDHSPMNLALDGGNTVIVEILINHGASPPKPIEAVIRNDPRMLNLLIQHRHETDARTLASAIVHRDLIVRGKQAKQARDKNTEIIQILAGAGYGPIPCTASIEYGMPPIYEIFPQIRSEAEIHRLVCGL